MANGGIMLDNKTAPSLLVVIGAGLLFVSLLADQVGIGDDPGFGFQQMAGTVVGLLIAAAGLYLVLKVKE